MLINLLIHNKIKDLNGIVVVDGKLVSVKEDIHSCDALNSNSYSLGRFKNQNVIITADVQDKVSRKTLENTFLLLVLCCSVILGS